MTIRFDIDIEFRVLTAGIYGGFACDHLLKEFRSDGNFARKRATISGDEQHGQGNACCKEHQCHCAGAPVIAVNHGNGDQGAESLKQNPHPFNRAYGRLADNNALASRIKRCMERSYQFRPSGSLAIIGGLHSEGVVQCFD